MAMRGLLTAVERHLQVRQRHPMDVELTNISAVEAVNWICALDERLEVTDPSGQYRPQRDADERGRVVLGVRYVRDRHMHQVVVSAKHDGVDFFASFPPQLSAGVVWRPAVDMPGSDKPNSAENVRRRLAYERYLQHQATWHALNASGLWLTDAVRARGITVPVWDVPLR